MQLTCFSVNVMNWHLQRNGIGTEMKSTTEKVFLDTNFLIYCIDDTDFEKRTVCHNILSTGKDNISFVISTQVLKELSYVMISKFKIDPLKVKEVINGMNGFEVVGNDPTIIVEAIDLHVLYKYSFWDCLILAAAIRGNCSRVLTEDMHHDHVISGLQIFNPFKIK